MKTDARVRYTRKVITDSFVKLLLTKPIKRITVTEICEEAEINRATFYKHYKDPYDLYDQLQEQIFLEYKEMIDSFLVEGVEDSFRQMLSVMKIVNERYGTIFHQQGEDTLMHRLSQYSFEHFSKTIIQANSHTLTEEEGNLCYCYVSGGTASVIDYWMSNGAKQSIDEIVQVIMGLNHMVTNSIKKGNKW